MGRFGCLTVTAQPSLAFHDGTESFNHPAEPMRLATPSQRRRFGRRCCRIHSREALFHDGQPRPAFVPIVVPPRFAPSAAPCPSRWANLKTRRQRASFSAVSRVTMPASVPRPAPFACHAHSFLHSHKHHLRTPLSPKLHSSPPLSSQLEMGV